MDNRSAGRKAVCILGLVALLAGAGTPAEAPNIKSVSAGLSYDHFTRSVLWKGDEEASKIRTHTVAVKAEVAHASGVVFSLAAGVSLADLPGLTFDTLPISLQFGGSTLKGFSVAAEIAAPVKNFGDFEIGAAGRIVYSFGLSRTWPLEGFAVEGWATGRVNWAEVSAGPRAVYRAFGPRVRPYVEMTARLFWSGLRMEETLGDLEGEEAKKVAGDFALAFALGADVQAARRVTVKAKAGVMPFAGGVDALVSVGVLYGF